MCTSGIQLITGRDSHPRSGLGLSVCNIRFQNTLTLQYHKLICHTFVTMFSTFTTNNYNKCNTKESLLSVRDTIVKIKYSGRKNPL